MTIGVLDSFKINKFLKIYLAKTLKLKVTNFEQISFLNNYFGMDVLS